MVVDCTRGVPQPDKAERLRATAIFLYGRLGVPVRAVILAAGSLPILQKDWAQYGVTLIDGPRLGILLGLVESGGLGSAQAHLQAWLRDVPNVGEI